MTSSINCGYCEEQIGKSMMENRVCTFLGRPMRRKFPTTRDLPKGCGLFASRFKLDNTDSGCANNTIVEDKNGEHLEGGTNRISKCEKGTQHSELKNDMFLTENLDQAIGCGLKKENPVVSSLQLDEPTLSNDDLANTPLVGMETSDTELARTEKSVQHDSTVGEFARHKDSAIRDLPKGCGRFASRADSDCADKRAEGSLPNGCGQQALAVDDKKRKHADIVQADSEGNANLPSENKRVKYIALPEKSNHHQVSTKTKATVVMEESRDAVKVERTSGLVHPKVQSLGTKPLDMSTAQHKLKEDYKRLAISSDRKDVPGLTAKSECPWRSDECSSKSNLFGGTNESKGRKAEFFAQPDRSKTVVKAQNALNHSVQKPLKQKMGSAPSSDRGQILIWGKKDSLNSNKNNNFQIVPKSHNNLGGHENVARSKVRETMRLFQDLTRKLLHEVEAKPNGRARVDLQAAKILKEKGKYVNTGKQILGSVPGVEVGDKFQYRVELNIIGLHRQIQGGIDYVKHNGKVLATSIVASGGYADDMDDSDVLIYTGSGGNVMSNDKEPEDQKLERGNLALKNSCDKQNPVRVIRGSESADKKYKTYVYDGLYKVDSYWQDKGSHGKLVYRFRLKRIPGQPAIALKRR